MLKNNKKKRSIIAVCVIAILLCKIGAFGYINYKNALASEYINLKTDPITVDGYKEVFGDNTDSAGRIWTDKSVSSADSITINNQTIIKNTNADFQLALSAISSLGKLSEKNSTPYEITLVLDVLGSIRRQYDTNRYEPTYLPDEVLALATRILIRYL